MQDKRNIEIFLTLPVFGGLQITNMQSSLRIRSLVSAFVIHL